MLRDFTTALTFMLALPALAANDILRWGGPGYDPSFKSPGQISTLFSAGRSTYQKGMIELSVDSEKTVKSVGEIALEQLTPKNDLKSKECWKAMRHKEAPWTCVFPIETLKGLSGKGEISVSDRDGKEVLKSDVDLDALAALAK
jgi:hypothetical protein